MVVEYHDVTARNSTSRCNDVDSHFNQSEICSYPKDNSNKQNEQPITGGHASEAAANENEGDPPRQQQRSPNSTPKVRWCDFS